MSRSQWLARGLGFAGAILLTLWLASAVWSQGRLEYPRPNQNIVTPNTKEWGVFRTQWRRWPGEQRLDVNNPRAVPAEVLPTPEAEKILPLPTITEPRQPPKPTEPGGPAEPEEGGFLSPGGGVRSLHREGTKFQGKAPEEGVPEESPPEGAQPPSNVEKLPDLPEASTEQDKSLGPLPFEQEKEKRPQPPPALDPKSIVVPKLKTTPPPSADSTLKQKSQPVEEPPQKSASPFSDESKPQAVPPPKEEPQLKMPVPPKDEPIQNTPPPFMEEPKQKALPPVKEEPQLKMPVPPKDDTKQTMWPPPKEEIRQTMRTPPKKEPQFEAPSPPIQVPNPGAYSKKSAQPQAAAPAVARETRHEQVVSLADDNEPERTSSLPCYRADPIEAGMPSSSAQKIKSASYEFESFEPIHPAASVEITDKYEAPPEALNGYCPVELGANGQWVKGDLRWTVVHKGCIYRLSGVEQRQLFLADPDRYAPVNSGIDLVLSVDEHRQVSGLPAYCATYNGRLYMFSSAASQAQFNKSPQRYATGK